MIKNYWKAVAGTVALLVLVTTGGVVHAQTAPQSQNTYAEVPEIFVPTLQLNSATVTTGGTVTGTFTANNGSSQNATNIMYSVSLVGDIEPNGLLADTIYDTKNFGPLFFTANETKQVPFSYSLPAGISGSKLGIEIHVFQAGGLPLGWKIVPLNVTPGAGIAVPQFTTTSVGLQVGTTTFTPLIGPTAQPGENVSLNITGFVASSTASTTLVPQIKLYSFDYSGQPIVATSAPAITVAPGKTPQPFSIDMTSLVAKPGVYAGQLTLTSPSGVLSSSLLPFKYIIAGSIYTIQSVTSDATSASAGSTVTATVAYSGTPQAVPADGNFTTSSSTPTVTPDQATITATLYNEQNTEVGSGQQIVDFSTPGSISIPIVTTGSATALRTVVTVTKNGVVVATSGAQLSGNYAQAAAQAQSGVTPSSWTMKDTIVIFILILLIILVLAFLYYALRRPSKENNIPPTPPSSNLPPSIPTALILTLLVGGALLIGRGSLLHAQLAPPAHQGLTTTTVIGYGIGANGAVGHDQHRATSFTLNTPGDNVPGGLPFQFSFNLVDTTCTNAGYIEAYYIHYGDGSEDAWGNLGSVPTSFGGSSVRYAAQGTYIVGPGEDNNNETTSNPTKFIAQAGQNTVTVYFALLAGEGTAPWEVSPANWPTSQENPKFLMAGMQSGFIQSSDAGGYAEFQVSPLTDTMPLGAGQAVSSVCTTGGGSNNVISGWSCDPDSISTKTLNDISIATNGTSVYNYNLYPASAYAGILARSPYYCGQTTGGGGIGGQQGLGGSPIANTYHGFNFPIPLYLQDGKTHTVSIFAHNVDSSGKTPYDYLLATGQPDPNNQYGGTVLTGNNPSFICSPPGPTVSTSCSTVDNTPTIAASWSSMTDTASANGAGGVSGDSNSQGSQGYRVDISSDNFQSNNYWSDSIPSQNTTAVTIPANTGFSPANNQGSLALTPGGSYALRVYYPATSAYSAVSTIQTPSQCVSGGNTPPPPCTGNQCTNSGGGGNGQPPVIQFNFDPDSCSPKVTWSVANMGGGNGGTCVMTNTLNDGDWQGTIPSGTLGFDGTDWPVSANAANGQYTLSCTNSAGTVSANAPTFTPASTCPTSTGTEGPGTGASGNQNTFPF